MAEFIEQTLLSVISQNYPNLEYIVIDGASTDGTPQIIEKYKDKLAYFISEPDGGMYDALSKGFSHATGEVCAWLNADDVYFPWTLRTVNEVFSNFPDVLWVNGRQAFLSQNGNLLDIRPKCASRTQKEIRMGWSRDDVLGLLQQENMFFRRKLYECSGGIDITLKYAGDFKLWMSFAKFAELVKVDVPLAAFRVRKGSLGANNVDVYRAEMRDSVSGNVQYPNILWRICRNNIFLKHLLRILHIKRTSIVFYEKGGGQHIMKKNVLLSASNFTFSTFPIYFMTKNKGRYMNPRRKENHTQYV